MIDLRHLHPIREGQGIYVEVDGKRIRLSPMQANLILQSWAEAVGGAMVFQASSLSPYGGRPASNAAMA